MGHTGVDDMHTSQVGLCAFLVERSFFPENEQNAQERCHRSEKNERLERVLKNIGTIGNRTERELLEKNSKNR